MSSFRITTNGLFRNYRTNLNKNNQKLNDAIIGVETQRKFNSYAEDPAAASKAWRLRRSYWNTNNQIDNNNYVISKYESASTAMHAIVDGDVGNGEYGLGFDGILSAIEGISGQSGAARVALGKQLIQSAENMVSVLNSKYGDEYVFAGADGLNIPFSWDGAKLLYRGIDVNTEQPRALSEFGLTEGEPSMMEQYGLTSRALGDDYDPTKKNIEQITVEKPLSLDEFRESLRSADTLPTGETATLRAEDYSDDLAGKNAYEADLSARYAGYKTAYETRNGAGSGADVEFASFGDAAKFYEKFSAFRDYAANYQSRSGVSYETGAENYAKLESMANETTYVDIGLGMKEDENGKIIPGSAFNSAVSGLRFLGYGKDNNVVTVIRELGEILSRADPETGEYADYEKDSARADELLNRIHETIRNSQSQHVQLEADAKYLKTNLKQLETNRDQLNEQITDTEDLEMGEAIMNMSWAQYCYNAALRIGTNILSQSLIDYMS